MARRAARQSRGLHHSQAERSTAPIALALRAGAMRFGQSLLGSQSQSLSWLCQHHRQRHR